VRWNKVDYVVFCFADPDRTKGAPFDPHQRWVFG
jgi:hypothetical protein